MRPLLDFMKGSSVNVSMGALSYSHWNTFARRHSSSESKLSLGSESVLEIGLSGKVGLQGVSHGTRFRLRRMQSDPRKGNFSKMLREPYTRTKKQSTSSSLVLLLSHQ